MLNETSKIGLYPLLGNLLFMFHLSVVLIKKICYGGSMCF